MTRYKQALREKGYWLECDYPYLPYNDKKTGIAIETVSTEIVHLIDESRHKPVPLIRISQYTVVGTLDIYLNNKLEVVLTDFN